VDLAILLASGGDVDNLFVCLAGTDAVSQRFWHYMETEAIEKVRVSESARRLLEGQVEALGATVERYYEYVDELVGELAALAGDGGTVAVITDHGYAGISLDASGSPRVGTEMHSEEGMWIAAGPGVAPGTTAGHGQLIDVAPTIMAAAGLDIPAGLDGTAHEEVLARQSGRPPSQR
jgi:predicted AlkP superfamily phosphohydrolase/phosphomutase